jgi:hypothetical protein
MTYRANIEDAALEFAKAIVTSPDQRELTEEAARQGITTVQAVASVSFDLAEAFYAERDRRVMLDAE